MKVAYIFMSNRSFDVLHDMIVPQIEEKKHGATVVGMVFFFDNAFILRSGDPLGERINEIAEETGMLVMGCDRCCYARGIDKQLISHAVMGCFPDVYAALGQVGVDQVITL
jgi:hypothetical protein